jgi:hypothetical protein
VLKGTKGATASYLENFGDSSRGKYLIYCALMLVPLQLLCENVLDFEQIFSQHLHTKHKGETSALAKEML